MAKAMFSSDKMVTEKRKSGLFPMYFWTTTSPNTMNTNWIELMMIGVLWPRFLSSELMKRPPWVMIAFPPVQCLMTLRCKPNKYAWFFLSAKVSSSFFYSFFFYCTFSSFIVSTFSIGKLRNLTTLGSETTWWFKSSSVISDLIWWCLFALGLSLVLFLLLMSKSSLNVSLPLKTYISNYFLYSSKISFW